MAQGDSTVPYADGLALLGAAFILLWLHRARRRRSRQLAQAALTVSGHLRRRPDRATEARVRSAFAELDRDMDAVFSQHVG